MTRHRLVIIFALVVIVLAAALIMYLPRLTRPRGTAVSTEATPTGAAASPGRRITATLFFVGEDGLSLEPVQREVPFGEAVGDQARFIAEAQVADAPAPYASAMPAGTTVRAVYVTDKGEAFVDLSAEATTGHSGGTLDELLAVYAIVNALTVNLPAVTRVQILVDGKEVDTLAGHVDLRQPLSKNLTWTKSTP